MVGKTLRNMRCHSLANCDGDDPPREHVRESTRAFEHHRYRGVAWGGGFTADQRESRESTRICPGCGNQLVAGGDIREDSPVISTGQCNSNCTTEGTEDTEDCGTIRQPSSFRIAVVRSLRPLWFVPCSSVARACGSPLSKRRDCPERVPARAAVALTGDENYRWNDFM